MIIAIVLAVILIVGIFFPVWLQVVLLIANCFFRDQIPFIDEILQLILLVRKAMSGS